MCDSQCLYEVWSLAASSPASCCNISPDTRRWPGTPLSWQTDTLTQWRENTEYRPGQLYTAGWALHSSVLCRRSTNMHTLSHYHNYKSSAQHHHDGTDHASPWHLVSLSPMGPDHVTTSSRAGLFLFSVVKVRAPPPHPGWHLLFTPRDQALAPISQSEACIWSTDQSEAGIIADRVGVGTRHWVQCHVLATPGQWGFPFKQQLSIASLSW